MRLELSLPKVPSERTCFFLDEERPSSSLDLSILPGSKGDGEELDDEDGSKESDEDEEEEDILLEDISEQHINKAKNRSSNLCITSF